MINIIINDDHNHQYHHHMMITSPTYPDEPNALVILVKFDLGLLSFN